MITMTTQLDNRISVCLLVLPPTANYIKEKWRVKIPLQNINLNPFQLHTSNCRQRNGTILATSKRIMNRKIDLHVNISA